MIQAFETACEGKLLMPSSVVFLGISMLHFLLDNCAVVGFIRPPASTQKWHYPAAPVWFGVTVIWLFSHHGTSNWLILENHRVSGQPSCLFLCQISCFFSALSGVICTGTEAREEPPRITGLMFLSVCSHETRVSVGVLVAVHRNQSAHACKSRFIVFVCFSCVLTGERQENIRVWVV